MIAYERSRADSPSGLGGILVRAFGIEHGAIREDLAMALQNEIDGYVAAARRHGEATEIGEAAAANQAYRELERYWKRIRLSKQDWWPNFLALLEDGNGWVRLWAAGHAVHVDPERGVPVLEALTTEPGFLGFTAHMTLKTYREESRGERT